MNLNKHKFISIKNHLKFLSLELDKKTVKNYWFFQPSLYQVHIMDINAPYPHHKISAQNPIQYFNVFLCQSQSTIDLIVITTTAIWITYEIRIGTKNIQINQISQSTLQDMDNRVVGVHQIDAQKRMIIFVKENGKIQYNYLNQDHKQQKTLKINSLYQIEMPNSKYTKSNLFSKFRGRQLLEIKNQNKIIGSAYNIGNNQLFVATEDSNSGVCSLLKFFLQDYEIISGADILLNLPHRPLQILVVENIPLINVGDKILVWFRNMINQMQFPPNCGFCTSLVKINQQRVLGCMAKSSQSFIYSINVSPNSNSKDNNKVVNQKIDKLLQLKGAQTIIHYSPFDNLRSQSGLGINSKLQIILIEKQKSMKPLLSNMQAKISKAILYQQRFSNYLKIVKQVGYSIQQKILTNNRIIGQIEEYQHNILIKMSNIIKFNAQGDKSDVYFTSPIIGTLKLAINFQQDKKANSTNKTIAQPNTNINIYSGSSQPNLITEQETLFIDTVNSQQITPTKLSIGKFRYNIADIFERNTDSIIAGCIVGTYCLLAVEKQVHIFNLDPKPKRSHIYVFDSQIKNVIPLNNFNLWGALLWDGSFHMLRIHQKQSVKINEIQNVGFVSSTFNFSFHAVINTAPHVMTLIGSTLIICSNDPLHIYQPEKTTLKLIRLPQKQIGQEFYPVIDLSSSKNNDKYTVLSNIQSRWMLLNFPTKYLVKNIQQLRIQVEQIIAFPNVQGIIILILKDSSFSFICNNKIINGTMVTGSITHNTYCPNLYDQQKSLLANNNLQYLRKWLNKSQIKHQNFTIETGENLSETHSLIIKLNDNRILLCGEKQIWYASIQKGVVKLISYFSMGNDAFLQFRNNLGVHELQNLEFMQMFADKLPIISVYKINPVLFAVLYEKLLVIVQIRNNGALAIKQQIQFKNCPGLIAISEFIGSFDQMSLYMRDLSHRLVLLKYDYQTNLHVLQIKQDLQDQLVCMHQVKGWKDRVRKIDLLGNQALSLQQLIVRKDGQLLVGNQTRSVYI